jgi:DUF917 family protein
MEQTAREKILQRILNLRARAEDDGSSEAEMNTAFTMAMKLMDSYNVEEAELALAENMGRIVLDIQQKHADVTAKINKHKHKVLSVLSAIAHFTSTKVVFSEWSGKITYTGHRPDAELANYLTCVCRAALDAEYDTYRRNNPRVGYGAKSSFQIAMANRISSRLYTMKNEQAFREEKEYQEAKAQREVLKIESKELASSTALVVKELAEQKKVAVEEHFSKAYPKLRTTSFNSFRGNNYTAHRAGTDAGNRVNLGRAISNGSTKMIGR